MDQSASISVRDAAARSTRTLGPRRYRLTAPMILVVRIVVCGLIFICGIEALYWPLLPKPGTIYAWWQIGALAKAGWYLAFAPLGLTVWLGKFTSSQVTEAVGWVLNVAWALGLFWLTGKIEWRRGLAKDTRA